MPKKEVWDTYPEVYHYTNFSSALLIIHSATLRATRFDSLNDTEELVYAKKIITQKLLEKNPEDTIEETQSLVEMFYYAALKSDFHITSFCGKNLDIYPYHRENGLLSMWRNYGADGGCAIIFKTKNIYDRALNYKEAHKASETIVGGVIMDEVIYEGRNDDQPSFHERLDGFVRNASNFKQNYRPENHDKIDKIEEIYVDLMELMICTKHPAFHEELEVRLGLLSRDEPGINSQNILKKQYHSIPFSRGKDISRIIIGPHRNQQERYDFLMSYLSKFDLDDIEVTKSEIPLRT
jgi:Protein of unknown function (DUF2971)